MSEFVCDACRKHCDIAKVGLNHIHAGKLCDPCARKNYISEIEFAKKLGYGLPVFRKMMRPGSDSDIPKEEAKIPVSNNRKGKKHRITITRCWTEKTVEEYIATLDRGVDQEFIRKRINKGVKRAVIAEELGEGFDVKWVAQFCNRYRIFNLILDAEDKEALESKKSFDRAMSLFNASPRFAA